MFGNRTTPLLIKTVTFFGPSVCLHVCLSVRFYARLYVSLSVSVSLSAWRLCPSAGQYILRSEFVSGSFIGPFMTVNAIDFGSTNVLRLSDKPQQNNPPSSFMKLQELTFHAIGQICRTIKQYECCCIHVNHYQITTICFV